MEKPESDAIEVINTKIDILEKFFQIYEKDVT